MPGALTVVPSASCVPENVNWPPGQDNVTKGRRKQKRAKPNIAGEIRWALKTMLSLPEERALCPLPVRRFLTEFV